MAISFTVSSVHANTRVVDPRSDKNYQTIQAAVDAAEPGDIIEIRSGVYFETVHVKKGGAAGAPIVIRPDPNGFVLINAGQPFQLKWEPAPGLPDVYMADVPEAAMPEKIGIWEMPARLRLASVASPKQVASRLGSWFYDRSSKRLYLRSSGRAPATELVFWTENSEHSAVKVTASFVEIYNLQATLGQHGFLLEGKELQSVILENCRAFCNSSAGIHVTGQWHRVRNNETFQNNAYGIQLRYGVNHVVIANNICYLNGPNNGEVTGGSVPTDLGIYSQGDFNVFEGNIVEGIHEDAYRNKTGHGANPTNVFRNNVVKGNQTPGPYGIYNNTLLVDGLGMRAGMYRNGGQPGPMRSWENVDPTGIQRAMNLIYPLVQKENPRFADPAYRDYRLQSDSPCLGHGAYPGIAPVFYVDPAHGSDSNIGLSAEKPLATIQAALAKLSAGGTLYLLSGHYPEDVVCNTGGLSSSEPLRIRAHGKKHGVVISGKWTLQNSQMVEIAGLEFQSLLSFDNVAEARIQNCIFRGREAEVLGKTAARLRINQCTFSESQNAITLEQSPAVSIIQSIFSDCKNLLMADAASKQSLFSAFNIFDSAEEFINGSKQTITLSEALESPSLGVAATFASDFGGVGARLESLETQLQVTNVQVAGLSPHGATLLWETPRQAAFAEVSLEGGGEKRVWRPEYWLKIMGTSFDITHLMEAFYSSERHAVLADLQPDTRYVVTLVAVDREGRSGPSHRIEFKTPTAYRESAVFYLSPDGNDDADGLSPEKAWQSFAQATAKLSPGDELVLLPGRYREILRPRVSGTQQHPITIRSSKPQEAVLDLDRSLPVAVEILNTDHLIIDGLLIAGGSFPRSQCFVINHARGITVRNCEVEWPEGSDFEKLKLGYSGLTAHLAPGLRVENNLFLCCVTGIAASHSPGAVIRNNTIVGEGNYGVVILPSAPGDSYTIENNLFYRATMGYKTNPSIWIFEPMPRLICDHNLFYVPENHKGTIGKLPETERIPTLKEWQEQTGLDKNSVFGRPDFVDPANRNFDLKPGSLGTDSANGGGVVGRER